VIWNEKVKVSEDKLGSSNLKIIKNKLEDSYTTFIHLHYDRWDDVQKEKPWYRKLAF
jgi:hypothetical protein